MTKKTKPPGEKGATKLEYVRVKKITLNRCGSAQIDNITVIRTEPKVPRPTSRISDKSNLLKSTAPSKNLKASTISKKPLQTPKPI